MLKISLILLFLLSALPSFASLDFACESYKELNEIFNEHPDFKEKIEHNLNKLELELNNVQVKKEKRLLKRSIRDHKKILSLDIKKELEKRIDINCNKSKGNFLKGIHLTLATIKELFEIPAAIIIGPIQGLIKRRDKNSLIDNTESEFYKISEEVLYQTALTLAISSPYTLAIPLITMLTAKDVKRICSNFNLESSKHERFCNRIKKIDSLSSKISNTLKEKVLNLKIKLLGEKKIEEIKTFNLDMMTDENFCTEQQEYRSLKRSQRTTSKRNSYLEKDLILHFSNNLDTYLEPNIQKIAPFQVFRNEENLIKDRKNIIVGMGPKLEALTGINDIGKNSDFSLELKKLYKMKDEFDKILKANSKSKCEKLKEKYNFSFSEYTNLFKRLNTYRTFIAKEENKILEKTIRKTLFLKNKWDYQAYNTVSDVKKLIEDKKTENIILVAHATTSGKIVDAHGTPYPKNFFENLPPHIRSISIFSCYPLAVSKFYGLKEALEDSPSFYSERLSFQAISIHEDNDVAIPMNFFKTFLKMVDKAIFQEKTLPNLNFSEETFIEEDSCTLNIPHGAFKNLTSGNLILTSNNSFIASFDSFSTRFVSEEYKTSCEDTIDLSNTSLAGALSNLTFDDIKDLSLTDKSGQKRTPIELKENKFLGKTIGYKIHF